MKWNQSKAMDALKNLIKGKEHRDEILDASKKGVASVLQLNIYIPVNEFTKATPGYVGEQTFEVHADTKIQSIVMFLNQVNDENICIAKGPEGGIRLGLNGVIIDKLHIFKSKK